MDSTDIFSLSIAVIFATLLGLMGYAVHMENMYSKGCYEETIRIEAVGDHHHFHDELVWRCEKKHEETPICR